MNLQFVPGLLHILDSNTRGDVQALMALRPANLQLQASDVDKIGLSEVGRAYCLYLMARATPSNNKAFEQAEARVGDTSNLAEIFVHALSISNDSLGLIHKAKYSKPASFIESLDWYPNGGLVATWRNEQLDRNSFHGQYADYTCREYRAYFPDGTWRNTYPSSLPLRYRSWVASGTFADLSAEEFTLLRTQILGCKELTQGKTEERRVLAGVLEHCNNGLAPKASAALTEFLSLAGSRLAGEIPQRLLNTYAKPTDGAA